MVRVWGVEDINESLYIRFWYGEEKFLLLFPFFLLAEEKFIKFFTHIEKMYTERGVCSRLEYWMNENCVKRQGEVEGGEIKKEEKLNRLDNNFNSSSVQLCSAFYSSHEMLIFSYVLLCANTLGRERRRRLDVVRKFSHGVSSPSTAKRVFKLPSANVYNHEMRAL